MQPYFSLILPVYHVEKYLDRCMQSILAQDFSDYEVILVDDGSPDRSGEICDLYAAQFDFVRVIHKPNGGLSSARNAGLDAARGEYVWFIDSDDWIEKGALRILREAGCASGPDAVKFNHYRVDESITKVCSYAEAGCYEDGRLSVLIDRAFCSGGKYVLSVWSHIYRRETLEKSGLKFVSEREVGSEDYLFNLSLLPRIKKVIVLQDALYDYDKREGSLTQKYRPMLAKQYACLHERLMESFDALQIKDKYAGLIHRFYVWHLMFGTCIPHEYSRIVPGHSMKDARKNVRAILRAKDFRFALRNSDRKNLPRSRRIQMLAMKTGFEWPLYYLFVIKRGKRMPDKR